MASKNFFSHTGSDGSQPFERVLASGYVNGGSGEVLTKPSGGNVADARRWVNAWMQSPGHCSIIMQSDHKEVGGACVLAGSSAYVTVVFGAN